MEDERIESCRNRVFETADAMAIGKNIPNAMKTNENFIYRTTGKNQLKDILACGYVRPREGKLKGGHNNEVFWSKGSNSLFYYSQKATILEVPTSKLVNDQIGAIPIEDLSGIWEFNRETNQFENRLEFYKKVYEEVHQDEKHKTK